MKLKIFIIILFFINACGKPVPSGDFNNLAWKADPLACLDQRKNLLTGFETIKEDLKGITEKDLQLLMGKPEATTLTNQSERVYIYYLEPGSQCQNNVNLSGANKLMVRISSLGFVTEINYENPVSN